ncbi:hypothetical protein ACWF95_34990, partial [Streptomyces vinaceus]
TRRQHACPCKDSGVNLFDPAAIQVKDHDRALFQGIGTATHTPLIKGCTKFHPEQESLVVKICRKV